jgi:hypothetical protein
MFGGSHQAQKLQGHRERVERVRESVDRVPSAEVAGASAASERTTPLEVEERRAAQLPEPGFRVQGSGFRVQGSGFRVQGAGFRVEREIRI